VFVLGLWTALLWLRPLVLFQINETLRKLPLARLPGPLGRMEMSLRGLLLVGFFHYHRRVLDAWIARHVASFRANFQARRTVKEPALYVPVPVALDGAAVPGLTVAPLREAFRKRGCLLIRGEGGSGKTTLACQVGHWALAVNPAERLCAHLMLP